jgi:hypothetical protein
LTTTKKIYIYKRKQINTKRLSLPPPIPVTFSVGESISNLYEKRIVTKIHLTRKVTKQKLDEENAQIVTTINSFSKNNIDSWNTCIGKEKFTRRIHKRLIMHSWNYKDN